MREITEQQLQLIANYLVKQPYAEVAELINMIVNLPQKKIETNKASDTAKKKDK